MADAYPAAKDPALVTHDVNLVPENGISQGLVRQAELALEQGLRKTFVLPPNELVAGRQTHAGQEAGLVRGEGEPACGFVTLDGIVDEARLSLPRAARAPSILELLWDGALREEDVELVLLGGVCAVLGSRRLLGLLGLAQASFPSLRQSLSWVCLGLRLGLRAGLRPASSSSPCSAAPSSSAAPSFSFPESGGASGAGLFLEACARHST